MTRAPSQADRADFAAYCRQASDSQVVEIYRKERDANRRVYADIAKAEALRRRLNLSQGKMNAD